MPVPNPFHATRAPARRRVRLGIAALAVAAAGAFSFVVVGQSSTPPSIPLVDLGSDPLYATTSGDKPALALALSVEFPTVGAQYVRDDGSTNNTQDPTYSSTKEYLGYYDAESCYVYNDAPTETVATGMSAADYKRFDRSGAASARKCSDAFSGNFLNWASSSAIDMLRLSLSGGDRWIDTSGLTILQRAVLPNGDPVCMWNSTNFPAKQLQRSGDGTTAYWGAVPQKMVTAANGSDIWVANTLDRIYFGTSQGGSCTSTSSYKLSAKSTAPTLTNNPFATPSTAVSSFNGTRCASEGETCSFSGLKEVLYGSTKSGNKPGGWLTFIATDGASCNNTVTGTTVDPAPGIGKTCYYRNYTGTPPNDTNALNSDGFFYARVQVCNSSGGVLQDSRDYGLCSRYPSGNYKPVGAIQKYSDQLRLAAFGYLLDQTASYNEGGRYGGVLRAPMKFVGPRTFDIYGQENTPAGGNPKAEWDPQTGVFLTNPDNDTTQNPGISGVVNYLNKFGRTGVKGRYKIYDPIGELYYETLRYMQGLQPSDAAVSNITTAMYDGFPVFTDWSNLDPYAGRSSTASYACLKSNIVVIGDIHTHDGNRFPAGSASGNIPDISYWTGIVQSFERNSTSTTYLDGQGVSRNAGNPNGANNSVPTDSKTSVIMGAAYWARTHDIRGSTWTAQPSKQRPGLRIKTFTFDVNEYGESSIANNRRYQNQLFMAAKYGGFETDPSNIGGRPFNTWGNPFKRETGTNDNDVWQKQSDPGEAASYYLQSSARGVLSAFDDIFSRAATSGRSIAGTSISQGGTGSDGKVTFQGSFDTANWTGDVTAYPLTGGGLNIGSTPLWSAANLLTGLPRPATSRNIVVGKKSPSASPVATSFTWDAIEASLKTDLAKLTPTSAQDANAQARLNYLRGNRTDEVSLFRVRTKLLGDIVNSGVVYSGAPGTSIASAGYAAFYKANKDRTPAVFVGANDGMLHAFNATTGNAGSGQEMFAYIPSWMGPKLAALTSKTYLNAHQSYVDATPVVAEAQVGTGDTASDWRTVLVGGTGGGGRGIYALDVTNPATFTASNVLWEFTQADDPDMGYVTGTPQILKFQTNALSAATPTYGWYAVVGSGVNNYKNDNGVFSTSGRPALFILDLRKPAGTAWALGTNYFKLSLPFDSTLATSNATGLINFAARLGSRGEVAKIFMGDLHGNVWNADFARLARNGTSDWTMETVTGYRKTATMPYPLYIARDGSGKVQPITAAPLLFSGEAASVTYVAFGTGKYLETSDRASTSVNSFYALYDSDEKIAADSPNAVSVVAGRSRLQAATVASTNNGLSITTPPFRWGRPTSNSDSTQRSGWYFDLPASGERVIYPAKYVAGSMAVLNSLTPAASGQGAQICAAAGGSGSTYLLNLDTGKGTATASTVGLLGPPLSAGTTPSGTSSVIKDNTGRETKTTTTNVLVPGSGGMTQISVSTTVTVGRLSWRQINNYQALRNFGSP